uniref:Uncharacterized protein n=1 Tax=Molossus molossus TaxID=27622 RepID=A0A7J8DC35_MOLMO|nr:hypothetical protein HJG59_009396 [Molossus molossus]
MLHFMSSDAQHLLGGDLSNSSDHELGWGLQSNVTLAPSFSQCLILVAQDQGTLTRGQVVTMVAVLLKAPCILFSAGTAGEALFPAQHEASSLDTRRVLMCHSLALCPLKSECGVFIWAFLSS